MIPRKLVKKLKKDTRKPMLEVFLGEDGLDKTWQSDFPRTKECPFCGQTAKIGFVACESPTEADRPAKRYHGEDYFYHWKRRQLASLYPGADWWLHDFCAVAVYFCDNCYEASVEWNQG